MTNFFNDCKTTILEGDCRELLPTLSENSIDLIVTSPPYAKARQQQYGGIAHEEYVESFLPIGVELLRILKPSGTFILNIKENVVKGERSCYVIDLVKALRKQGWLWTEEFIWSKKNPIPGKWNNRFRDGWERLLQFNKHKRFAMYQEAVKIPCKANTAKRLLNPSVKDLTRDAFSASGSGFGHSAATWVYHEFVYPSNVLYLACETKNRHHSAVFPESLPEWFVKLFTVENDTVLDPFMGSGTVGAVCNRLNRNFIGIEKMPQYVAVAKERINNSNIRR
ncbi:methyltransferase [Planctomycetales bacterium]|nr:methyltransferase [Planctomycetales bacterium]